MRRDHQVDRASISASSSWARWLIRGVPSVPETALNHRRLRLLSFSPTKKYFDVFFMTITAFIVGVRIDEQASSDSKDESKRLTERQFKGCLAQCSQCWTRTFSSPAYGTMLRNQYLPSRTITTHNEVFRMRGIEAHMRRTRNPQISASGSPTKMSRRPFSESGTTEELDAVATPQRDVAFPG